MGKLRQWTCTPAVPRPCRLLDREVAQAGAPPPFVPGLDVGAVDGRVGVGQRVPGRLEEDDPDVVRVVRIGVETRLDLLDGPPWTALHRNGLDDLLLGVLAALAAARNRVLTHRHYSSRLPSCLGLAPQWYSPVSAVAHSYKIVPWRTHARRPI